MNKLKHWLFLDSNNAKDVGLLILRIGIGLIFVKHGYPKIMGGPQMWQGLGGAMANLGITFAPTFWGFMAACSEFFGGLCLIFGFLTRPAAFLLGCVMFTAVVMHASKGDPWSTMAHPLSLLVVFIALFVAGAGNYSVDRRLRK
ncbi:DoxX family protein [Candidatus Dependentiae bacterium]|nr:DoxX family protein [Candidatus Dependentiae bacterium]